jgi:hypothetical protein
VAGQVRIGIEELEGRRKDADDLARLAIHDEGLPDNVMRGAIQQTDLGQRHSVEDRQPKEDAVIRA